VKISPLAILNRANHTVRPRNKDQPVDENAQILAMINAIIGASVSLLIFIFTQWFLAVRGKSDFLRTKLEELCLSFDPIITFSRVVKPDPKSSAEEISARLVDDAGKMIEALQKPLMFCTLYFPDITPRLATVISATGNLNEYMHKVANGKVALTVAEALAVSKPVRESIQVVRDYIRDYYTQHIKTPGVVAKSWLAC
jgi:hypothetical protein